MSALIKHLTERHMDIALYKCVLDENANIVVFFLYNLSGQIVGYHQYRPHGPKTQQNDPKDGRYYTFLKDNLGVWGLDQCDFETGRYLYITEGIFDACRLHNIGLNAIAVLSNDPKRLRPWLKALNVPTIAVCDGDAAGKKLANSAKRAIILPDGRDLGDMTYDEVWRTICDSFQLRKGLSRWFLNSEKLVGQLCL